MVPIAENARDLSAGVHRHEVLPCPCLCHVLWVRHGHHRELHGLHGPSQSSSWDPRRSADSPEMVLMLISWSGVWRDPHQWQSVREDVVSDVVPPDGQLVQLDWVAVLQSHFDRFQVGVHRHVNTRDGSMHLRNGYFIS